MQRSITLCLSFSLIAGVSVLNVGCAAQKESRAYSATMKAAYLEWLEAPYVPTHEEVKAAGVAWSFNRSLDQVWQSCVDVGAQYSAVLASRRQSDGSRQLVLNTYLPSGFIVTTSSTPVILVVSAKPLSSGRTEVAVAGLSPIDKKLTRLSQRPPQIGADGVTDQQVYEAISSQLSSQRPPAGGNVPLHATYHAHAAVNRFCNELSVQMLGPGRWQALHAAGPPLGGQRGQALKRRKAYRRKEIENKTGDFVSASLRRSHVIVADSGVSKILDGMVRDLLQGAGQHDCPVKTYVIASPEVQAFALPNGDVFVSSGLLDSLEDRSELAFVLAHELDHLIYHDTLERLERADTIRIMQHTLMAATSVVGSALGAGAKAGASASRMAARQATRSAIMSTVSTVGMLLGEAASAAIVEGYSQRSELRADANAAQYALAAGYDPAAALGVFAKLQEIEIEAGDARTAIKSSLMNAKPGLQKRIERMEATLAELGVAQRDKP